MSDFITDLATHRKSLHDGKPGNRPGLSDGYEEIGLLGEIEFGKFSGICPDFTDRPDGDNGYDFVVPMLYTLDVKTFRKAHNLIHEAAKPLLSDIYVLAHHVDGRTELVGWEWRRTLLDAPTRKFHPDGPVNRYIPREKLRPMSELGRRIWRP